MAEKKSRRETVTTIICAVGILWFIYALCFTATSPSILRPVFVMFIIVLGLLLGPRPGKSRAVKGVFLMIDCIFTALVIASTVYIIIDQDAWVMRAALGHNGLDLFFSVVTVIAVLELTRCTIGYPLVILALLSMAYAYFAGKLPGIFRIFPYSLKEIFNQFYGTGDGLFACAVESVASIGGQIMPPVMASAAFLASDLMGIPYGKLIIHAIVPAVIYYWSLYLTLDLEAGRLGMRPAPEERPEGKRVLRELYLLLPLVIIIFEMCILGRSPLRTAAIALLGGFVITEINPATRLAPLAFIKRIAYSAYKCCKTLMPIGGAFICASLVVAMLNLTGLGIKLSSLILSAADGRLLLALLLTMLITIILGMGLPVAASYVIAASVCAPSLVQMGIPMVAAHMFILHFASLSCITPPVALAAYTAAGIAGEKPLVVAVTACLIGLCAFFVPYCFVFGTDLLLLNGVASALLAVVPALVGCVGVVLCVIGWCTYPMLWIFRSCCLAGGVCMLMLGTLTDVIGLLLIIVALAVHYVIGRKNTARAVCSAET